MKWKLGWKFPWCYVQAGWHEYALRHKLYSSTNGRYEAYLFCACGTVWRTTETRNQSKEFIEGI